MMSEMQGVAFNLEVIDNPSCVVSGIFDFRFTSENEKGNSSLYVFYSPVFLRRTKWDFDSSRGLIWVRIRYSELRLTSRQTASLLPSFLGLRNK